MYIHQIETIVPQNRYAQNELADWMINFINPEEKERRLLKLVYQQSAVESRHSALKDFGGSPDLFQTKTTPIDERMNRYHKEAKLLAIQLCNRLTFGERESITDIIYVSCTGMAAPGMEVEIINHLGLSPSTRRLNITFMGCYAMITALKQAKDICKSKANSKVLIISIELCTLHLQQSQTYDAITSGALFADGGGLMLVDSNPDQGFKIEDDFSYLQPDTKSQMSWDLSNTGFIMGLSNKVPSSISKMIDHIPKSQEDVMWAVHPGGRRILDAFCFSQGIEKEKIKWSYETLKTYGNMSSATICFVLKEMMQHHIKHNQKVNAVAFGPGLVLEGLQLRYQK